MASLFAPPFGDFVQDIPKSLKTLSKRENGNRLHVIVMTDGGKTGRFTFSTTFFWVMGLLLLVILSALFLLAYKLSRLMVEHESDILRLAAVNSYYETKEFNRTITESPIEAGLVLERLDQAALMAENLDNEPILPWGVETNGSEKASLEALDSSGKQGQGSLAETDPNANSPGQNPGQGASQNQGQNTAQNTGLGSQQNQGQNQEQSSGQNLEELSDNDQGTDPKNLSEAESAGSSDGEDINSDASKEEGQINPTLSNQEGQQVQEQSAEPQASPEAEAWGVFQKRLPKLPDQAELDVDDFRVTPNGNYSYYLKRIATTGERLRGRAITIFAVSDKDGKVALVSVPQIDLGVPSQGYDLGGKYNIVSSKVYRGSVKVPQGGQILSAQVLAWDESTKELIFQKKIIIGGPRSE